MCRLIVRSVVLLAAFTLGASVSSCGSAGSPASSGSQGGSAGGGKFKVVAAENFWGSIAAQLAGNKASVTSIVVNPSTDPHTYEPTAQDARTMASANLAIVNGLGYDNWAPRFLEANPSSGRVVLNVGDRLGLHEGDNPHRWYYPSNVRMVIDRIVAAYDKLDPTDAAYFARQKLLLETRGLARYDQLRRRIRARYSSVPVGYSESIFQGLGEDLGLRLLTPYSFAKAIAEGTGVSAQDKQAVDAQVERHQIGVWIFNSQNVTPDVQRVNRLANEQHIPIATVTETLAPPTDTFEQWQVAELEGLTRALHRATGR